MLQGKGHFCKRKIRPFTSRPGGVRSILAKADIRNQVDVGHDAEAVVYPRCEEPLVVPVIDHTPRTVGAFEFRGPVLRHPHIANEIRQPRCVAQCGPSFHAHVHVPPGATPGGPAPADLEMRQEIAGIAAFVAALEVAAGNLHDSLIITIQFEQLVAVTKERRVGEAVIFKDDSTIRLLKYPVDPRCGTATAPEVYVRVFLHNFTRPVDALDDGAGGSAFLGFARSVRAGTIGDDKHLRRPGLRHSFGYAGGDVGTIKDNQYDRSMHEITGCSR